MERTPGEKRDSCFVMASSSTVYGGGAEAPFKEDASIGVPLSPYGAS